MRWNRNNQLDIYCSHHFPCPKFSCKFNLLFGKFKFWKARHFQILIIFSAFNIVRDILEPVEGTFKFVKLVPSLIMITLQYFMKLIVVYSASKTTAEAKKTSIIVARLMNDCDDKETFGYSKFLSQIQTRNLNIQNVFFVINWSLLVMVKLEDCELRQVIDCFTFQTTSTAVTYLVITCQFDVPSAWNQ